MAHQMPYQWLGEAELAALLGVSTATVLRMRKKRVGPPHWRFLGRVKYRSDLVAQWIEATQYHSTALPKVDVDDVEADD